VKEPSQFGFIAKTTLWRPSALTDALVPTTSNTSAGKAVD